MERIVLAYSGGLETSAAIPWLRDTGADVITVTVDLGQGGELEEVRDRALAAGAVRAHVLDLREEFARSYITPALKAGATLGGRAPLAAALARPLVARALLTIAGIEQAATVAHGGTGGGSHRARLDTAIQALNPTLRVLAPARDWTMARGEIIRYASQRNIPVPPSASSPFHAVGNLWGRAVRCPPLEDPGAELPEELFTLTKPSSERPSEAASVEIAFERGVPAAINGVAMPLLDLISSLTTIAGAHGVGRIDLMEPTPTGGESRTLYEAPAAVVLHAAHAEMQALVTMQEAERFSHGVSRQYVEIIAGGLWYSPLREALDAFVDRLQACVTGVVRLELFKGDCRIVGRTSPHAGCGDAVPSQPVVVGA